MGATHASTIVRVLPPRESYRRGREREREGEGGWKDVRGRDGWVEGGGKFFKINNNYNYLKILVKKLNSDIF